MLDKDKSSLSKSGINLEPIVKTNVKFIILTFLTYLFIQATNLLPAKDHAWVSIIAYLSFAISFLCFIHYSLIFEWCFSFISNMLWLFWSFILSSSTNIVRAILWVKLARKSYWRRVSVMAWWIFPVISAMKLMYVVVVIP